jgi:hypothetical protein
LALWKLESKSAAFNFDSPLMVKVVGLGKSTNCTFEFVFG